LTRTEVNIAAVTDLFKNNSQIASRMIAESLNIPKTTVLWILKEDMGKRKLRARSVPHSLTPEQREDRVTSCQEIIAMADADKNFLKKFLQEMRPGVLPMTPKQSDRVLKGLVRHPLGRRN
jgi:DNA-binding IscR family transcriptional regulator